MPTIETKKQHFLPFAYLKYFRCCEDVTGRPDATILRDDGDTVVEEKVANQCYANNLYRKNNTNESEQGLGVYESDWDKCISTVRTGVNEDALLMLQIVMYHFRNISIRIQKDDVDRYTLVTTAVRNFVEQKILKLPKGVEFADDPQHVTQFPWIVRLIKFKKPLLITSDNPSVMTIQTKKQELYGPFFIPVSPTELMVAIDKSQYEFHAFSGTDQDAYLANAAVAGQSSRHVYMSEKMEGSVRASLWDFLGKHRVREQERGVFEEDRFVPTHPVYENPFSFIKKKPKRFAIETVI